MAKDKRPQIENFSLTNSKIGTFYKIGGRHTGGKIICEDGTEFVVLENPNIVSGSVVEFEARNGTAKIENVVALNQKRISGFLYRTKSGDVKFVERTYKGIGKQYTISNDKNSEFIRGAFGRTANALVVENDVCIVDKVFEVIGSLRYEAEAIVDKVGMSQNWSAKALAELRVIPESVDLSTINLISYDTKEVLNPENYDKQKPNYYDFRDKLFCTIDPVDCQDMDDAVCTEIDENGNLVTYAAIADVTEYINPRKTPNLWQQAQERAMSLYYMYGAQDMLPHKIASGICSLNEGQDRLTMCVKTTIDPKTGKRLKKEVIHAVINSKKKFSYQEVQKIIDADPQLAVDTYKNAVSIARSEGGYRPRDLVEAIYLNQKVADALKKERSKRESLTFESKKEPKMELSEDGKQVKNVKTTEHLPSMGMIEALMVNANEVVGETLNKITDVSMNRVHGKPNDYKIDKLNAILEHFEERGNWDGSKQGLRKILNDIKGSENEDLISSIIITCLDRAKYSVYPHPYDPSTGEVMTEEKCHSALDSDFYTHFTSGIRRFPDLIAQHMLKIYEREGKIPFDEKYLKNVAAHATSREKELDDAEKEIRDLGFAAYAENHVNDVVEGRVCEIDGDKKCVVVLTDINMRISIPIEEFFKTNRNVDKYIIDQYGIAVYKDGQEVVSLGEKVQCKISGSNRVLREIYGSKNLTKTFEASQYVDSTEVAYRILEEKVTNSLEKQIQKALEIGDKKQREIENRNNRNIKRNGKSKTRRYR